MVMLLPACLLSALLSDWPAGQIGDALAQPSPSPCQYDKKFLDQDWSCDQREAYWFRPQGSQLIPYAWFLVLEQAGSTELFRSDAHMNALRFVTAPPSARNPDGLPIGFAKDRVTQRVGFSCAACHTSQIDFGSTSLVIDGGPTLAHVDRFLEELVAALEATRTGAKFDRFAHALGTTDPGELRERMRDEIAPLRARVDADRMPAGYPEGYPGFGRLDAFGQIYNQVAGLDLKVLENVAPPTAPASYPSLWLAPWASVVQWNGSGQNRFAVGPVVIGPLLRNVVEVIGVFGRLSFSSFIGANYPSDVDVIGLGELEYDLCTLHAPKWPAELFGKPDGALRDAGEKLYRGKGRCIECHPLVADEQAHESRLIPYWEVGTDPTYVTNAHDREADTGRLKGKPKVLNPFDLFDAQAPAYEILRNAVVGVVAHDLASALSASDLGRCGPHTQPDVPKLEDQVFLRALEEQLGKIDTMPLAYRARALNGVWATAPYLHNGSVPNLADLLRAPEDRTPKFFVGSREFDPVNVGLVSSQAPGTIEIDTTAIGNSNQGHRFSSNLTDQERRALLEYLKTL